MRLPRPRRRTAATDELTCRELVRLVTAYLEGTLSEADRCRFDAHLTKCEGCSRYVAQMRETIRVSGVLTEQSLEPEVRTELLTAFRTWKQQRP